MGKKAEKTFIVRGVDMDTADFFQPTGVIEDIPNGNFKEVVVKTASEAIITMLTDSIIGTMSTKQLIDCQVISLDGNSTASFEPGNILSAVDITIMLDTIDKLEVRALKTGIRETVKHWAEKSRVKNRRGFRSSAIRTPTFEYLLSITKVKFQVILSNAIVYSNTNADISVVEQAFVSEDMALLRKQLVRNMGKVIWRLDYNHSTVGYDIV